MKQLTCEMCGSTDMVKQDGMFVCQSCGTKYSVEEAKKMMVEGTVSVEGVVKTENADFEIRAGELIAYHGAETDVVIPDGVKIIGENCFKGMQGIESVSMPDNVYRIKAGAFAGCSGLKRVELSKELKEIESAHSEYSGNIWCSTQGAFACCTSLSEIELPEALVSIGGNCFEECSSLRKVKIPNTVTTIGACCFRKCSSLSEINISEGVTEIEDSLFDGCTLLKSVHLPSNIKKIGHHSFRGMPNLVEINLPLGYDLFKHASYIAGETEEVWDEDVGYEDRDGENIASPEIKRKYESEKAKAASKAAYEAQQKKSGCYIATAVYGSYDCPQVWILRRYRDNQLAKTRCGRAFIRTYYAVSPTLVKWFGDTKWFRKLWKGKLDRMVENLNAQGVENTPYQDRNW